MFIHFYFIFPETAGKTLEETEAMFEDPNGIKYLGTPAWKTRVKTSAVREMERGHVDLESKMEPGHTHTETVAAGEKRVQERAEV